MWNVATSDARRLGPVHPALLTRCIVRVSRDDEEGKEDEEDGKAPHDIIIERWQRQDHGGVGRDWNGFNG